MVAMEQRRLCGDRCVFYLCALFLFRLLSVIRVQNRVNLSGILGYFTLASGVQETGYSLVDATCVSKAGIFKAYLRGNYSMPTWFAAIFIGVVAAW